MRQDARVWPVVIAACALAVGLMLLVEYGAPVRSIIVIWFLAICPGMAFVPLLPIKDGIMVFTVGVGVSLALDALIAEAMIYIGHWSAPWSLAILVGIVFVGAIWQVRRGARGWPVVVAASALAVGLMLLIEYGAPVRSFAAVTAFVPLLPVRGRDRNGVAG